MENIHYNKIDLSVVFNTLSRRFLCAFYELNNPLYIGNEDVKSIKLLSTYLYFFLEKLQVEHNIIYRDYTKTFMDELSSLNDLLVLKNKDIYHSVNLLTLFFMQEKNKYIYSNNYVPQHEFLDLKNIINSFYFDLVYFSNIYVTKEDIPSIVTLFINNYESYLSIRFEKQMSQVHSIDNINIREATKDLFIRYTNDFKLTDELILLAEEGINNIIEYPLDKLSRWLGFIQGYIIFSGQSTVEIERDFSRPKFHNAYKEDGINIPKSFDTKNIITKKEL